jgi:ribokinase
MKIINFGSLNLDLVYQVERFAAPGETISCLSLNRFCGGKGLNQSIALSRCGAAVSHAGCIGTDGAILREALERNGADCSLLREIDGPNGHAIIQVDPSGQNSIIVHGGSNRRLTEAYVDEVLASAQPGDMALLQNETNLGGYIARAAKKKGLTVACNPSPIDKVMLREFPLETVDIFLVNEHEAAALTGTEDPDQAAENLLSRFPAAKIVVTLGERGVNYRDAEHRYTHKACDVPVVDTTAAGDTFTGFFLGSLAAGKPIPECLRIGSIAAALAVSVMGASDSIPALEAVLCFRPDLR